MRKRLRKKLRKAEFVSIYEHFMGRKPTPSMFFLDELKAPQYDLMLEKFTPAQQAEAEKAFGERKSILISGVWDRPAPEWLTAARAVISRIKYKPGCEIHLFYDFGNDAGRLLIRASVIDATDPEQKRVVQVECSQYVTPPEAQQGPLVDRIRTMLQKIEMHEVDEFLKLDGRHVQDPHPELHQFSGYLLEMQATAAMLSDKEIAKL